MSTCMSKTSGIPLSQNKRKTAVSNKRKTAQPNKRKTAARGKASGKPLRKTERKPLTKRKTAGSARADLQIEVLLTSSLS